MRYVLTSFYFILFTFTYLIGKPWREWCLRNKVPIPKIDLELVYLKSVSLG
jgi:hypothetical protein